MKCEKCGVSLGRTGVRSIIYKQRTTEVVCDLCGEKTPLDNVADFDKIFRM